MEVLMTNRLKQHLDMQEVETEASPSLANASQKRQTRSQSSAKVQEKLTNISQMVEKIKGLSRRKAKKNDTEHKKCHSCSTLLDESYLVSCNEEECLKSFCFRCLNKKFNKSPKDIYDITTSSYWNCVSCQGHCPCKGCKTRSDTKLLEFPSKQMIVSKTKKTKKNTSLKVESETGEANSDTGNKKSNVDPSHIQSPLKFSFENELSQEMKEIDLAKIDLEKSNIIISIPSKPRSKSLARKFRNLEKSVKFENDASVDEDTLGFEEISNNLETTQIIIPDLNDGLKMIQNSLSKEECHMCHNLSNSSNIATCSIEHCKKHYCIDCIRQFYQQDFDLTKNYNPAYWICFSCGGVCECQKCKRRRDAGARRSQQLNTANEQLSYLQFNRKNSKLNEKRRIKYYDTLSEDEEEAELNKLRNQTFQPSFLNEHEQPKTDQKNHLKTESQNENSQKDDENKYLMKKKRLTRSQLSMQEASKVFS